MTGTGGNPNLKPLKADQYDTSFEWYFAPSGSLTFAAFDKVIKDYFLTDAKAEPYTNGGQNYVFDVTRTYNGSRGNVGGFELAYQQFYDFLPGAWSGLGFRRTTRRYSTAAAPIPPSTVWSSPELQFATA